MNVYVILLRILHIFAGVFWVGAAATFVLFIAPSAAATRPESQKFVNHLLQQRRFATVILIASTLGILAGLLLYWQDSAGFQGSWILSPTGLGFTAGALAALLAYGVLHIAAKLEALGNAGATNPKQRPTSHARAGRRAAAAATTTEPLRLCRTDLAGIGPIGNVDRALSVSLTCAIGFDAAPGDKVMYRVARR